MSAARSEVRPTGTLEPSAWSPWSPCNVGSAQTATKATFCSGFYAWVARPPSTRAVADAVLTEQIRTAFADNRQVYGSPRIHVELTDLGVHVGRKRVARLMRSAGIVVCHRRKRSFSITTKNPKAEAAPDLVDRKATATRTEPAVGRGL